MIRYIKFVNPLAAGLVPDHHDGSFSSYSSSSRCDCGPAHTPAGSALCSQHRMQSFLQPASQMTNVPPPPPPSAPDPVRVSVGHLLSRAYSLPCSTAAQAFTQLVQPMSRFQLALDALLPLLEPNTSAEVRVLPCHWK